MNSNVHIISTQNSIRCPCPSNGVVVVFMSRLFAKHFRLVHTKWI